MGLRKGMAILIYYVVRDTKFQGVLLADDSVVGRGGKGENRLWKRVTPIVTEFAWLPPDIAESFCRTALYRETARTYHAFNIPHLGLERGGRTSNISDLSAADDQVASTPELLLKTAAWRNQTMAASSIHSDEPELASKLWEVTNQGVQRGFLKGPYDDLRQVQLETGCDSMLVNRRFLLVQGEAGKPRAIDDCKTSG